MCEIRLQTEEIRHCVLNGSPKIQWNPDKTAFSYERESWAEDGSIQKETVQINLPLDANAAGFGSVEAVISGAGAACNEEESSGTPGRKTKRVLLQDYDLYLEDTESGERTRLTFDGAEDYEYGAHVDIYSQLTSKRDGSDHAPYVLFSPDERYFLTYAADRRNTKRLPVITSFERPGESIRPRLEIYACPFPEDSDEEIPHYRLFIGDVQEKIMRAVDAPDFLYPIFTSEEKADVRFLEDGSGFYFVWIARGYKEARLYLADCASGVVEEILRETTDTFLNQGAFGTMDGFCSFRFSCYMTTDRKLAFWWSEASGYAHLYRYRRAECAAADGSAEERPLAERESVKSNCIKNCAPEWISEGDLIPDEYENLIVQKLVSVDETKQKIYFYANNVEGCSDPLYYQLFVIDFDGKDMKRLTPEDACHSVSVGRDCFVDTYSTVIEPPVTVLRSLEEKVSDQIPLRTPDEEPFDQVSELRTSGEETSDPTLPRVLERADAEKLYEKGYVTPIPFTVYAEDGQKLSGVLIPPANLEEGKEYPLIDYIYGGAQIYNVPRTFTWDNPQGREIYGGLETMAQLGFAGVILDGRGTPGRGKKFHEFSYHNIQGCCGHADHVYVLPQLKKQFPFLDLNRVGMWGNSAGGYATVTAMLTYPEIYKVGVASAGNYDQRMYEHSWTERYYGLYDEKIYAEGDITKKAENLQGKLMLAVGCLDDNVSMSQTVRLCDAFNRADKEYELVLLPRCNHNCPADPYFVKRRTKFFAEHL
ncbi:MAG: prolyl oligopeptidase family serine peptidase [Lachnospiraceae bacterium]|nr:prolyl oligopeptidase family serine peptidase [Lachnospiraceae bacterium]